MSTTALEHYKIEQRQILQALQIKSQEELKSLIDNRYQLGSDIIWTLGFFGLFLSTGVVITTSGALMGLAIAFFCAIGSVIAGANDSGSLAVLFVLACLGGVGLVFRAFFREADLNTFLTVLMYALVFGATLFTILRGYRFLKRRNNNGHVIARLMQDVTRFHDAVDLAQLQVELSQHGAAPPPSETLHRGLATTRVSLLRALSVHGAMRAHGALLKRAEAADPAGRFLPGSAEQISNEAQQCAEMLSRDLEALAAARLEIDEMK